MKKLALLAFLGLGALAACDKPSDSDCRKAVTRIRELAGTDKIEGNADIETAVRSCRGNATKSSVKCAMEASSLEQLEKCGLMSKEEIEALEGKDTSDDSGSGSGSSK